MLSEVVLKCHENSIKEFSSLCTGGENWGYLSKMGAETVSEMLATIRELQARVAELETMWQQEHTERIRLEEQAKYLSARLESEIEASRSENSANSPQNSA
jgi:uncharacterized membrane protein YccC